MISCTLHGRLVGKPKRILTPLGVFVAGTLRVNTGGGESITVRLVACDAAAHFLLRAEDGFAVEVVGTVLTANPIGVMAGSISVELRTTERGTDASAPTADAHAPVMDGSA